MIFQRNINKFCHDLFEEKEILLKYFDDNNKFPGEEYEVEPLIPHFWPSLLILSSLIIIFEYIVWKYAFWVNFIFLFFTIFLYYFEQKQNKS